MNLSLAETSKVHFLQSIADDGNKKLVAEVRKGKNCKITIDNIDWRTTANQVSTIYFIIFHQINNIVLFYSLKVRLGSGNKDFHYTHWTVLPDRFDDCDLIQLDDTKPCRITPPKLSTFYCSPEENISLR